MKSIFSLIILFLLFAGLLSSGAAHSQTIKGSDTVLPLTQLEAETYMKSKPSARVTVTGGGSGVGFAALVDGSTEIAMTSRKIKLNEKMKLQEQKQAYKEVIIAYDALAVVVNPANKVSKLTREQLSDIFTGKITNWKQLGGDDMKIVVYSRESSSGTYEFFKDHIMDKKNFASSVLSMPATGAIIQSVSQTKGAIGYVGLAYVDKNVKDISVSFDGKVFAKATLENAQNKTYPVVRPLYFYYLSSNEAKVKPFVDYILSPTGQALVLKSGYIPLKK